MGKNIVVAGLGHGGIVAAALLAEKGFDVTVYEKNSEGALGYDWTDMFDPKALEFAGLPMPPADKFRYKENMTFCGPGCKKAITQYITEKDMEIIMERKDIYTYLIGIALEKGVKIVYDCEVLGPISIGDRVVGIKTAKGDVSADLVIDSCGMNSSVRRNLPVGLHIQNEIENEGKIIIYRAFYNKCSDEETLGKFKIILFAGGHPGISWVASHESYTDVLIGRFSSFDKDDVVEFTEFLRRNNPRLGKECLRGGQFVEIPVRHALSVMVADGYAAIGDCAFMTMPLIGSGIANAIRAAKILADTIVKDTYGFYSAETLWEYQVEYYNKVGGVISTLECVKNSLVKLTPQDVDYLFTSELVTSDDMKIIAGLSDINEIISTIKKGVSKKVKGIKNNKHLVAVVSGIGADMCKVLLVLSRMPKKWDREKVYRWAKAYDKAFKYKK
ncbi:MAG: NAD(P)/FAD-dependent oxidoreductase [Clostridia bacterium]|nr:NAD(P)/FAD-dependent oxidoreductase [Clostridia bacterium]